MMQRPRDRTAQQGAVEHALHSLRVVMTRMADVLWQADAAGNVTAITLCRPSAPAGEGDFDVAEVRQIEDLWRKSVRCAERFGARYQVRAPDGVPTRTFFLEAIPVFDDRDEVRYWAGSATEVDRLTDSGTRFISEAAAVLSSSLNRATIVNRLVQTAVENFCDRCAIYALEDSGAMALIGIADRRNAQPDGENDTLQRAVADAVRSRQPSLLFSSRLDEPARSTIVAPLFVGASCVGAVCFLERDLPASFARADVDVAIVVARQLAMALENIKTFERERHITERFRFLARTTERLFATLDSGKMLQLLLDGLVERFADCAVAATLGDGRLRVVAASGTNVTSFRRGSEREITALLQKRRSVLKVTEPDAPGPLAFGPLEDSTEPASWMMVPLYTGESVRGAIVCCARDRRFNRGDLELLEEIGRRASLALEHAESFARERRLAHTLQQATLPSQLATVENATLSFVYRPAALEVQVGGDWYDAFDLGDGRVLLTVGDVTGHGLPASIVMGKLRHAINVVAMYERNPVRILDAAEHILLRRYPGAVATAFVAVLDPRADTISYANAGHPYPLLRRADGSIKELEAEGLPIGLRCVGGGDILPSTERLSDVRFLAFYTDGLTEATRDTLEGERLLRQVVGSDAILYVERPAEFVEAFCLQSQSPDDVAILTLNFVASLHWRFDSRDCAAARLARQEFLAAVETACEATADVPAAELIFGELAANVARHAPGPVEVALDWRGQRAVLHVIDRGSGYAASRRDPGLFAEHGRGLWLAERLGAELEFEVLPGFGTHVQAVLPIRRSAENAMPKPADDSAPG